MPVCQFLFLLISTRPTCLFVLSKFRATVLAGCVLNNGSSESRPPTIWLMRRSHVRACSLVVERESQEGNPTPRLFFSSPPLVQITRVDVRCHNIHGEVEVGFTTRMLNQYKYS